MADHQIKGSVGVKGRNLREDVRIVQKLLNERGSYRLKEDGQSSPLLIEAISNFQSGFLPRPDGRVDPGGKTFAKLLGERESTRQFVQLPQQSGRGYYSYDEPETQWGTSDTIQTILDIAGTLNQGNQPFVFGVGHISYQRGGHMKPHQTHRTGINVDIRPMRSDGRQVPVKIGDPGYSYELTKLLVEAILAHSNVKGVLFNDGNISGVTKYSGHDNHLHLTCRR